MRCRYGNKKNVKTCCCIISSLRGIYLSKIINFNDFGNDNKIHISFPTFLKYSCECCHGLCCHVNNSLFLTKQNYFDLGEYSKEIQANFVVKDVYNNYLLKCGKECWFLTETGCQLVQNGLTKPLTCELYPYNLIKIYDIYVLSFIPCPVTTINSNLELENIELNVVKNYISSSKHLINELSGVSKARVYEEISIQKHFLESLPNQITVPHMTDFEKILYSLYCQIRWRHMILCTPIGDFDKQFIVYQEICNKFSIKYRNWDISKVYFIVVSEFINYIRKEY